jgi:hypothetical protein
MALPNRERLDDVTDDYYADDDTDDDVTPREARAGANVAGLLTIVNESWRDTRRATGDRRARRFAPVRMFKPDGHNNTLTDQLTAYVGDMYPDEAADVIAMLVAGLHFTFVRLHADAEGKLPTPDDIAAMIRDLGAISAQHRRAE